MLNLKILNFSENISQIFNSFKIHILYDFNKNIICMKNWVLHDAILSTTFKMTRTPGNFNNFPLQ